MGEDAGDKATGIKVDLRLVKDTLARRKKEASKANVEVAKFGASFTKITGDSSKLEIISKSLTLKFIIESFVCNFISLTFGFTGNKIVLFSVTLEANGVYVAVREKSAFIPSHVSHIEELKRVIKLLLKFKTATMDLMAFGLDGEDKHSSSNISWLRGTWVPPTREKKRLPALPEQLFCCK
ncbi:hypothetical protein BD560DRAFT_335490 [Blakeslea trispora]|nr:hypothetical protein BD560DRAFT_335490 [Blakeslea trispora]